MKNKKEPSPENQLKQLDVLEIWCTKYESKNPHNHGSYDADEIRNLYKPLRDWIVFYSSGWGWRVKLHWREVLNRKRQTLQSQISNPQS